MGKGSSPGDGNYECLTQAVSSAVNAPTSELWLAVLQTWHGQSSDDSIRPLRSATNAGQQRGQRTSAPYRMDLAKLSRTAPRHHHLRARARVPRRMHHPYLMLGANGEQVKKRDSDAGGIPAVAGEVLTWRLSNEH